MAGWAVVSLTANGELYAVISGRVGRRLPQTSAAAEHVASLAACEHCTRMTTAMTDYAGLVDLPQWPPSKLYDRTSYYAGVNALSVGRLRRKHARVSFE